MKPIPCYYWEQNSLWYPNKVDCVYMYVRSGVCLYGCVLLLLCVCIYGKNVCTSVRDLYTYKLLCVLYGSVGIVCFPIQYMLTLQTLLKLANTSSPSLPLLQSLTLCSDLLNLKSQKSRKRWLHLSCWSDENSIALWFLLEGSWVIARNRPGWVERHGTFATWM